MKTESQWRKIGQIPHHGVCIPLFAIHTKNSPSIGEFLDLLPLIDWCKTLHLDTLQLLPLNDSGHDPSPYYPISSCALDPIYISLTELGLAPLSSPRNRLEILNRKLSLLHKLFEETFPALSKTAPYLTFLQQNPWLASYSRFKALREQYNYKSWNEWPSNAKPEPEKVHFYTFLQFHAFRQMSLVHTHAQRQKIFLKGDIPILLNPDSADVWANPPLFLLDYSAGAPPDAYNAKGQKWGSPLFNMEAHRKTHFQWWKQRIKTLEPLYDIYRIDHVVGFFRIWGIPEGKPAINGSFFPPDPATWDQNGKEFLEMAIDASPLLPMAEDLGTIPKSVYPILKELGICGTKVIRWEKQDGRYTPFDQYEPFSLTTLSTHDTEPLELWWKNCPSDSIPFAEFLHLPYHPILSPSDRLKILHAAHHTTSLFHLNLLQEYLALFPELVSPNPAEERINIPGTLLPTNWNYRFRTNLETIISHQGLKEAFQKILELNDYK